MNCNGARQRPYHAITAASSGFIPTMFSKALGRELLLSESIAHRCGRPVLSLGRHKLRGVLQHGSDLCRGSTRRGAAMSPGDP
jgi:hypothetical protein